MFWRALLSRRRPQYPQHAAFLRMLEACPLQQHRLFWGRMYQNPQNLYQRPAAAGWHSRRLYSSCSSSSMLLLLFCQAAHRTPEGLYPTEKSVLRRKNCSGKNTTTQKRHSYVLVRVCLYIYMHVYTCMHACLCVCGCLHTLKEH